MDPRQTTPPRGPDPGAPPQGGGRGNGTRYDWEEEFRRQAEAEAHPPGHDLEALLLSRMDVRAGDVTVGREHEVDRQQLAAGVGGRLPEDDPLAADRVVDDLSCVGHCLLLSKGCGSMEQASAAARRRASPATAIFEALARMIGAHPRGRPLPRAG